MGAVMQQERRKEMGRRTDIPSYRPDDVTDGFMAERRETGSSGGFHTPTKAGLLRRETRTQGRGVVWAKGDANREESDGPGTSGPQPITPPHLRYSVCGPACARVQRHLLSNPTPKTPRTSHGFSLLYIYMK